MIAFIYTTNITPFYHDNIICYDVLTFRIRMPNPHLFAEMLNLQNDGDTVRYIRGINKSQFFSLILDISFIGRWSLFYAKSLPEWYQGGRVVLG